MPRYLVERVIEAITGLGEADRVAAQRFPEVSVEHRFAARDGERSREVWVCRAPSHIHLRRWAEAIGLAMYSISQIDADLSAPSDAAGDRGPT